MGASLSYSSKSPVPASIRSIIVDFLVEESSKREWWAEPLAFFESPQLRGHIVGDTKLFCLIDDVFADCFMAMNDAVFIVELLEVVSKAYKCDWTLSMDGSTLGSIAGGQRDQELVANLKAFAFIADGHGAGVEEYDRESLLQEYSER